MPPSTNRIFWLSFCDSTLPEGSQFLGACVIEVTEAEATGALLYLGILFPSAQPGAEWVAAATSKARSLGCNPGGEVACFEMPPDHPYTPKYTKGVLMDRAEIERIDKEIKAHANH